MGSVLSPTFVFFAITANNGSHAECSACKMSNLELAIITVVAKYALWKFTTGRRFSTLIMRSLFTRVSLAFYSDTRSWFKQISD